MSYMVEIFIQMMFVKWFVVRYDPADFIAQHLYINHCYEWIIQVSELDESQ